MRAGRARQRGSRHTRVPALLPFVVWAFGAGITLFVRETWHDRVTGAAPAVAG